MKIDEKNDAVGVRKFEIRLSFPLKSHFLDERNRVFSPFRYYLF